MKLGAGAYGAVYKGILVNNVVVAVKQLFRKTNEGSDDLVNEVLLIANLKHRNLVTLKGYCLHGKQTLLVYEYVDNCDLDKLLLRRHSSAEGTCNSDHAAPRTCCEEFATNSHPLPPEKRSDEDNKDGDNDSSTPHHRAIECAKLKALELEAKQQHKREAVDMATTGHPTRHPDKFRF